MPMPHPHHPLSNLTGEATEAQDSMGRVLGPRGSHQPLGPRTLRMVVLPGLRASRLLGCMPARLGEPGNHFVVGKADEQEQYSNQLFSSFGSGLLFRAASPVFLF